MGENRLPEKSEIRPEFPKRGFLWNFGQHCMICLYFREIHEIKEKYQHKQCRSGFPGNQPEYGK
ncbi:MAG: hypothetical protein ACLUAR_13935 [Pilosibacter sp.]